jgi:hypothetical protein
MNVRKLLDWRKLLLYSHRWMGIAFGLLFVSWFVSGIAFMYWGMPTLTPLERQAHQKSLDLSTATVTPLDAAKRNEVSAATLRMQMKGDRPVYSFGRTEIFADTGEPVPVAAADREQALEVIVVILLSIGGILLSGTTLWPMVKRLARHGHRVVMVFRPARARESERVSAD